MESENDGRTVVDEHLVPSALGARLNARINRHLGFPSSTVEKEGDPTADQSRNPTLVQDDCDVYTFTFPLAALEKATQICREFENGNLVYTFRFEKMPDLSEWSLSGTETVTVRTSKDNKESIKKYQTQQPACPILNVGADEERIENEKMAAIQLLLGGDVDAGSTKLEYVQYLRLFISKMQALLEKKEKEKAEEEEEKGEEWKQAEPKNQ